MGRLGQCPGAARGRDAQPRPRRLAADRAVDSDEWRESIVHPVPYAVSPPFRELAELMRETGEGRQAEVWKEALRESVAAIAGLTAVDGAAVITEKYDLLAFGAKIQRRRGAAPVES